MNQTTGRTKELIKGMDASHRRFCSAGRELFAWEKGGRTDLANLLLVCTFHHKLVHEYRWAVQRESNGMATWFQPDGCPYRAGPAPPAEQRRSAALQPAF